MNKETYRSAFPQNSPFDSATWISHGLPYEDACAKHISESFRAKRIFILASGSLSRNTDSLSKLEAKITEIVGEGAVVGTRNGIKPHTHYTDVLEIIKSAKASRADCLITLGGGSLTDAAKIVSLALANSASTTSDLETLSPHHPLLPSTIPIICIPTSLSAGEYTPIAGATNDETHHKHGFRHASMQPKLVILDPRLTTTTPGRIWLSTGIRAVDHCVEAICSVKASLSSDKAAEAGLRKLLPGVLSTKTEPEELEPRMHCQLGAIDAISTVLHGIPLGASHGIGHQLGPLGVGHGETSCILLPAVCKYNATANLPQQEKVLDILWSEPSVVEVLNNRKLNRYSNDLGDALDAIFKELGLPRSLKDVGIGRECLDGLAESSLRDAWCRSNPRPLKSKEDALAISKDVVGERRAAGAVL